VARKPVVAIDGPAGAGKSTIARLVAERLGLRYIETGAMYRAAAYKAAQLGIAPTDAARLGAMCAQLDLRFESRADGTHILLDGHDITEAIRDPRIGELASQISALPAVREPLVAQQRRMAEPGGAVLEGRDIQTVVCPDAEVKIFLTASAEERARRRLDQLQQEGRPADFDSVLREVRERDARDQERAHSPLRPAPDAVILTTDGMTIEEAVAAVLKHVTAA
jgi:cytidylate kinase